MQRACKDRFSSARSLMRNAVVLILLLVSPQALTDTGESSTIHKALDEKEIRAFILHNYRPLSIDLLRESGPYLESLCVLLKTRCNSEQTATLRSMLLATPSISDLALQISEMR